MSDGGTLSLEELADRVGIEKRTIRSYIQQGMLPAPEGKGRYAHYTVQHLTRLKALRFLRQYEGRNLDEIRPLLLTRTDAEIEDLAARFDRMAEKQSGLVTGSASATSALEYIRTLKRAQDAAGERLLAQPRRLRRASVASSVHVLARGVAADSIQPQALKAHVADAPSDRDVQTPIDALLSSLEQYSRGKSVPRKAKGEAWITIRITPDFEMRVRGVKSADQLARLERIADHLREALLGGLFHEQSNSE